MKKLIWVALAIILVFTMVFAGCGKSSTTSSATTSSAAPATTTAATSSTAKPATTTSATSTATAPPTSTSAAPTTTATTTATSAITKGGTLRWLYTYSLQKTPGWPTDTTNVQRVLLNWVVFEPLVRLGLDGVPQPYLATSWKWANDYKSITFNLRKGVVFHDGTPFTSEAVVTLGQINIDEKQAIAANWDHWAAVDDNTVTLFLKKYTIDVFVALSNTNMMFFSPTAYKKNGKDWIAEHPTGTGPFKYGSWTKDVDLKFVKNDNYWQPGKPYLDGIQVMFVTESLTLQSTLKAGGGDFASTIAGKPLADFKAAGFNVIAKAGGVSFIYFDNAHADSPYANPLLRQAVEHAIDKKSIVDALGYGYMQATNQMTPPQFFTFNSNLPSRDYNPTKAKQLLTQAGYPNGLQAKMITMSAGSSGAGQRALAYQQNLKDVGINVTLDVVDNAGYWNYAYKGFNNEIAENDYAVSLYYPVFINGLFPPNGNHVSIKLPDGAGDILSAAMSEPDPAKFKKLNDQLIQSIYDSAIFVPVYASARGFIMSPKVHNTNFYEYSEYNMWDPADTWLSK
jgi:peptide/nickel transport system substrate-binding protein